MGYLICEECGRYYELEKGESLDKFSECQCGGKLRYTNSLYGNPQNKKSLKEMWKNQSKTTKLIIISLSILIPIGLAFTLNSLMFPHYESTDFFF